MAEFPNELHTHVLHLPEATRDLIVEHLDRALVILGDGIDGDPFVFGADGDDVVAFIALVAEELSKL